MVRKVRIARGRGQLEPYDVGYEDGRQAGVAQALKDIPSKINAAWQAGYDEGHSQAERTIRDEIKQTHLETSDLTRIVDKDLRILSTALISYIASIYCDEYGQEHHSTVVQNLWDLREKRWGDTDLTREEMRVVSAIIETLRRGEPDDEWEEIPF